MLTVYEHMNKKDSEFYQDQYSAREKRYAADKAQLEVERKDKERQRQAELEQEVVAMKDIIQKRI